MSTPELRIEQDRQRILAEAQQLRPINTTKTYASKAREFEAWMNSQEFIDGSTVTAGKVVSFLCSVRDRPSKVDRLLLLTIASKIIGFQSIKSYSSACIDLYQKQVALGQNNHSHPKFDPAYKAFIRSCRSSISRVARQNYVDRGSGTIQVLLN